LSKASVAAVVDSSASLPPIGDVPPTIRKVLGPHPQPPAEIAKVASGADGVTSTRKQHRLLTENAAAPGALVEYLRKAIVVHHNDPEKVRRVARQNERLQRQGVPPRPLYPSSVTTQKGNVAEIALAEYIVATEGLTLPVYRLRHNPNIEQSMKGDDVLAFDLDATPPRILVGESKFRSTPRREDAEEIVEQLLRSEKARIPVSLQFVADRLYDQGDDDLAARIEELQFALGRGRPTIEHVGLLLGPASAAHIVKTYTPATAPRRLAMISLSLGGPDACVSDCFRGLG
jgi:hypothetical protein